MAAGLCIGCSSLKPTAVTWEDIAHTIPSDPKYVVSVNRSFAADSALNDLWASPDVMELVAVGLDIDTEQPSHIVVAAMDEATFITWPVPNPREADQKLSDWDEVSLNNTVDAHIKLKDNASIVVSSTQIWVVNNKHGEYYVNELLTKAMDTKAANSPILNECIISTPSAARAVIPHNNRFYNIDLSHKDGCMTVDVVAYDKFKEKLDIVEGLGTLPQDYVDRLSAISPFAAAQIPQGSMPEFIEYLARLADDTVLSEIADSLAPVFAAVSGSVIAHWDDKNIEIELPFVSEQKASEAERKLRNLDAPIKDIGDIELDLNVRKNILQIKAKIHSPLPPVDKNRQTPHLHSLTQNPSAVAYGRFDIGLKDPAETYFELAPTRASLRIDYNESKTNTAKVVLLIKTIIFRLL